ncbi:hypothetical protein ACFWGN_21460, partial [Oerskovia sp. NPDC060338]|uniref:hypothetical protein n=1 Tax=Oerskovia sp. NPDC060338 TaxID=3347100 RepID=UPI0036670CFA
MDILTAAGLNGTDHVPERYTPPIAVVSYGSPMIETGAVIGSHTVRLEATVVVAKGSNSKEMDSFDADITAALLALSENGWAVDRIDEPIMVSSGTATYLAATISMNADVFIIKD